ncbi:MAG TPA: MFS transporter [Candidatus Limnocylindrales bacterium]|nr:MFS transporter [Candidatus Limnocylindrales bacterium]
MTRLVPGRPPTAAVVGCLGFLLLGWSGLLVPSLIRSIEHDFGQSDAGMGLFYLLNAAAYVTGSMGGGAVTERIGRRRVLATGGLLIALGLLALATVPSWSLFLLAAIPFGLGSGVIDGGGNALFLDLFAAARGRALNLLHLFFSLGALGSPFIVGRLVESGVGWQALIAGTGVAAIPFALALGLVDMPSGHHEGRDRSATVAVRPALDRLLLALAIAIALYVASEIGVSNWLVRFLSSAPLGVATTGLTLFWAGLTLGRLTSARLADRFDHARFASVSAVVMAGALVCAVVVPSLPLSLALFALAGFASGPVYPLIMAIGGERFPGRSAAVAGFLAGAAVAGGLVYPPLMGLMSVTVGLPAAMVGTALLGLVCGIVLFVVGRRSAAAGPLAVVDS